MKCLASPSLLSDRAHMLAEVRRFFQERAVLEVDCPSLVRFPAIDTNVDVMDVRMGERQIGYLHTSPEYAMKRLLALGSEDIYQIAHVFRKGELGSFHSPEFTMVEWYRVGVEYLPFIEETCALMRLFVGNAPLRLLSYRKALQEYAGIDPMKASQKELIERISASSIDAALDLEKEDTDTLLALLVSHLVEPHLGENEFTALYEFPASQAALARTYPKDGHFVAERFEIYRHGVELCNGYHELANGSELKTRFQTENERRSLAGKDPYPLDEPFLEALDHLPDCCGVSVGFDRLMMLRHKKKSIHEILPLSWS